MGAEVLRLPGESSGASRFRALDREVLLFAMQGDEAACRALYRWHEARVHAFLVRMVGDASTRAEDLLQETFVRVFRALPRFDPDGPATLSTWILTIAYRLSLNSLRRQPELVPLDDVELIDHRSPDDELRQQRVRRALVQAVLELGRDHRAAFLLRDFHDLSYAEIASVLGVGVGTVKSRLFRARRQVRRALEEVTNA